MTRTKREAPRLLDWQRVRRLSELTLLNRIALVLLVAIPMVVAVWPKYQSSVLRYNRTLDAARERFNLRRPSTDSAVPRTPSSTDASGEAAEAPASSSSIENNPAADTTSPDSTSPDSTPPYASDDSASNRATGVSADGANAYPEPAATATTEKPELADDKADAKPAPAIDQTASTQEPAEQEHYAQTAAPEPQRALEPIAGAGGYIRAWGMDQPLLETRVEANWIDPLPQNRQLPIIPRTWAMAFMAALCILIGDTLRQLFCPTIVRDFSLTDYIDSRVQLFASAPSSDTFSRAVRQLRTEALKEKTPEKKAPDDEPSEEGTADEEELPEHLDALHGSTGASPVSLGKIESASRSTYESLATKRPIAILLSIIAYSAAVVIIVKIIQEQTINVLSAAGWI